MSTDLSKYKSLYIKTAKEYLNAIQTNIELLNDNPEHETAIESIYISAHSLKSQSLMMGYKDTASLSKFIEDILRNVREGAVQLEDSMIAEMHAHIQKIQKFIDTIENNQNHNKKILIVDDDEFFQTFYAAKLQEYGYDVVTANDGIEGLEKITSELPDLILLDIIMPKKNGFEVLQALSQDNKKRHIPVIIFSTLDQKKDIEEVKNLGAVDFITKGTPDWDSTLAKIASYMPQ